MWYWIEICKFHYPKYPINNRNEDVNKITSDKIPFGENGFKYFTGYKDDEKFKPLYVMLPIMSAYTKKYDDETKYMSFLIEDDELLKNTIKSGIKSALLLIRNLIVIQRAIKTI